MENATEKKYNYRVQVLVGFAVFYGNGETKYGALSNLIDALDNEGRLWEANPRDAVGYRITESFGLVEIELPGTFVASFRYERHSKAQAAFEKLSGYYAAQFPQAMQRELCRIQDHLDDNAPKDPLDG